RSIARSMAARTSPVSIEDGELIVRMIGPRPQGGVCPPGDAGYPGPGGAPYAFTDRGLRIHRRHADGGARRQGRFHRLAVPAALRLGSVLRRRARRRAARSLAAPPLG